MIQKILQNFSAVIFDMDGVLIDSEKIWQQKEPDFIEKLFPDFPRERCHEFVGRSAQGIFEILKEYNTNNYSEEIFIEKFRIFGRKEIYSQVEIFDGLEDLLKALRGEIPIALASSSLREWIQTAMEKTHLEKYFDTICSAEDIGGISKPAPDIFLYAAKNLKVSPEKCLVIEDAHSGILAAKAANMTAWGFRNSVNDQQDFSKADFIFTSFTQ